MPGGDMLVVDSPYEVANWRPLVHWLMYIPHHIINYVLTFAANVVGIVYWVTLIVTGRLHPGMYGFLAMQQRYQNRIVGFLVGYTEVYAPFDFNMGATDNGVYPPIRVNLPEPPESTPRTAALNFLLAIPHYIVFTIFAIGAVVVLIIGWFAVLFTGVWPAGMRDFLVRLGNYWLRIWVYVAMVETKYPKFGI
jgi:hypothetical protein